MSDILTAPTIAYMINYGESGPKEAADKLCTSRSGDDPGKRAECMDKERDKFMADVLVFSKAAKVVSFTIYRRARNTLAELSKSRVEFDKDSANGVIVKVLSDKGTRVLFPGKKEFTVSAPTDSSIEIDDPQSGKLIYEARIGLVDKPAE